jgi:phosphodiesterase/alkaline phosphatase D-like protein
MKPPASSPSSSLPRREFLAGAAALSASALTGVSSSAAEPAISHLGPILGHADDTSAMVWVRAVSPGEYALEVTPESGGAPQTLKLNADEKDDLCLHWRVTGLTPGSRYRYRILQGQKPIAADAAQVLLTPHSSCVL